MEKKIKIIAGQDTKKVTKEHLRFSVSHTQPMEETLTLAQLKGKIAAYKASIATAERNIVKMEDQISEWEALQSQIEKQLK